MSGNLFHALNLFNALIKLACPRMHSLMPCTLVALHTLHPKHSSIWTLEQAMNGGIERHGRGARYERRNKDMAVEHGMNDGKDMAVEHGMNGGIKTWPWSTV